MIDIRRFQALNSQLFKCLSSRLFYKTDVIGESCEQSIKDSWFGSAQLSKCSGGSLSYIELRVGIREGSKQSIKDSWFGSAQLSECSGGSLSYIELKVDIREGCD